MTVGTQLPSATRLRVHGMNCGACARKVTVAAQTVPTVQSVEVDVEGQLARIHWDPAGVDIGAVSQAVESAGYRVEVLAEAAGESAGERQSGWREGLWVGVGCTVPMLIGEWAFRLGDEAWWRWLSFVLGSVVQVTAGARFYQGAEDFGIKDRGYFV